MKAYPEKHQHGHITVDNREQLLNTTHGDFGIQIAEDGRVWICFNGISVIRFSPHPDGKMSKGDKYALDKIARDGTVRHNLMDDAALLSRE